MVPLKMLTASFDTDACASGVISPKSHVAHFTCLDLRNGMVPLTMPLASHDPSANGVTCPKYHIGSHFDHID